MKRSLLSLSFLLMMAAILFAAFSSTETFDSYTSGVNLNTQNAGSGWGGAWADADNGFIVTNTTPAGGQGGISVKNTTADGSATRTITGISAGIVSWEMRISITNPNDFMGIVLREAGTGRMYVRFGATGNIEIYNNSTYQAIAPYSANTWYRIAIEFDDAAQPNLYRVQVNGGALSNWVSVNGAAYTNIDSFTLDASATGTRDFWLDDIRTTTITPLTSLVTFDAATSSSTNPPSFSHINGSSSSNDIIFCECRYQDVADSISAMTYGGVAMTAVIARQTPGNNNYQEWWYVKNPATGSNTLAATLTGAMSWIYCTAYTYYNVNQTTPLGTAIKATASATSVSVTAASTVGELVTGVNAIWAGGGAQPAITVGAQQTERFQHNPGADSRSAGSDEYGTTGVIMSGSWTGINYGAVMAVAIKPASVTGITPHILLSRRRH